MLGKPLLFTSVLICLNKEVLKIMFLGRLVDICNFFNTIRFMTIEHQHPNCGRFKL